MIEVTRLSLRLLRRHLALYAGCMATLAATTVVASAQAGLVEALSHPDRVQIPDLSPAEVASQLVAFRGLLSVLTGLVVVTSGFLMWSAVKQVVSFRQRELALMRLAGASRWRLAQMVTLECVAMGVVVALPSMGVGLLLAHPLFAGLQAIGFFGQGVEVQFGFAGIAGLLIVGLVAFTVGLAGLFATLGATRGELISAINPLAAHMSRRQVLSRAIIGAVGLAGIALLDADILGPNLILVLPLFAVVPLFALAPLLIPAGAWLVGRIIGVVAPGPGLLAAQRARKDRVRFAQLATPVIVAVGVLGGFLVANAPDEQIRTETYRARLAATAIASVVGIRDADGAVEALRPQSRSVARLASLKREVSGTTLQVYFTDAASFSQLLTQSITSGDADEVGGAKVASSISGAKLGDSLSLLDSHGTPVTLTVAAVIDDSLFEGVFIDWAEAARFVPDTSVLPVQVFASPVTQPTAQTALEAARIQATVIDRDGYIQYLEETRKANTYRSNIGIFGTIYLMSVISLIQAAVSGNLARRREFKVLRSLGISRGGLLQTVGTETLIVQVVAGVLIGAVLVTLGLRFASTNNASAATAIWSVTPPTALAYAAAVLVAMGAQLISALLAIKQTSETAGVAEPDERL